MQGYAKKVRSLVVFRVIHRMRYLIKYTRQGNIDKVLELLRMMRSIGVSPTAQSYAATFETLGRLPEDENNTARLTSLHNEMKSKVS